MAAPAFTSTSFEPLWGAPDPAVMAQREHGAQLHNQGMALERQGRHAEAVEVYKKAIEHKLATVGPDSETTAVTYNALAESYIQLGQLDLALENVRKALAIVNREGSSYNRAYYRDNHGLILEMKGDLEEARRIRLAGSPNQYLCSNAKCQPQVLRPLSELSRCGRCKAILYCSTNCRNQDWKRHKNYCRETKME